MVDIRKSFTGQALAQAAQGGVTIPGGVQRMQMCHLQMGFSAERAGAGLVVSDSTLDVFSNLNNSMFCSLN